MSVKCPQVLLIDIACVFAYYMLKLMGQLTFRGSHRLMCKEKH